MSELEARLGLLAAVIEWPPTPEPALELAARERRRWARPVALAVAVVALGIAIAFAVPPARSAILRFLGFGGVRIERVETLPAAEQASLAQSLGNPVDYAEAESALGLPFRLPSNAGHVQLYLAGGVASALLATPAPVLLSELSGPGYLLKKIAATATNVEDVQIAPGVDGLWISGAPHVLIAPAAPPRLAGNVLLWQSGAVTFRLEGRPLPEASALRLAREILDG